MWDPEKTRRVSLALFTLVTHSSILPVNYSSLILWCHSRRRDRHDLGCVRALVRCYVGCGGVDLPESMGM